MPPDGFKSLTLKTEIYDYFLKDYQQKKPVLQLEGIFSFNGYITRILKRVKDGSLQVTL